VTFYLDSQSALQARAKSCQQSGQMYLREITNLVSSLRERWTPRLIFRWVPGHSGVRGNERAQQAARRTCQLGQSIAFPGQMRTVAIHKIASQSEQGRTRFWTAPQGKHTKHVDRALPQRHTKRIYHDLNHEYASIMTQLRTGKARRTVICTVSEKSRAANALPVTEQKQSATSCPRAPDGPSNERRAIYQVCRAVFCDLESDFCHKYLTSD